jgi:hypothetical protein
MAICEAGKEIIDGKGLLKEFGVNGRLRFSLVQKFYRHCLLCYQASYLHKQSTKGRNPEICL